MSKNKMRIFYNIMTGLLSQGVTFLLAFLIPRLFLVSFGSEVKGMLSTITQVFAYLWLLEAGVGLATVQALYSPISRDDRTSINAIMTATSHYYKKTGYLYFAAVILFAGVFSFYSDVGFSRFTVFLIVLMQGMPNVVSYLVQGKYRLLLEAEGKSYVLNNLQTGLQFFVNFGKAILLSLTNNILLVQSLPCISAVIQVCFLLLYMKKHYGWLDLTHTKPDYQAISQKSSVLIHQISGVIFNNTDILLFSVFCGFKTVSVYTVYQSFFSYVETLFNTLSSSIMFRLGQLFHSDREQFIRYMDIYETCYLMLVFIFDTVIYLFILPIIQIYTRGINDIKYIDVWLPILFVFISLLANGKMPMNQIINFAEQYSETKSHAIIEAAINIIVSFTAVIFFGIYGGLLGTIAALLFRGNIMIFYANRKILHRNPLVTYKKWIINCLVFLCTILVVNPTCHRLASYLDILVWGFIYGVGITILYLIVTCITQPSIPMFLYQYVKERRN
ncbi:MAG: sugar isomerase [Lachnospiraceae bacterium]|nr:sugar isomerase [Lachnospiraceae bacterium]